jgi:hypothetical protein
MSTLLDLQQTFALLSARLIIWANEQGYGITYSEAYRSPQEAALNAKSGAGIAASLHCERLAIDLNLFKDGVLLESVADNKPLGDHWKTLSELARWGGDFSKPDADHFSLTYLGVE